MTFVSVGMPSPWDTAADALDPREDPLSLDGPGWAKIRLGAHVWSVQRDIMDSVRDHRYTAVPSCFDSGKSWIASVIAAWWLDTHPIGQAFVVSTAPVHDQIVGILWREIQARFADATKMGFSLPGRVTQDAQWKTDGGMLIGFGRKPSVGNEVAFAGIHDRFVLVIMDEADGIPQGLYDATDGLLTNADARCLAIGNPWDATGPFAKACAPGSGWNVLPISAYDTPNFTGEVVPDHLPPLLVSPEWVEERKRRWGEGSPRWVSKVLGQFPKVSDDTLIEPAWVQRAAERDLVPDEEDQALSADVARYGADETCVGHRRGGHFRIVATRSKQSTMRTAGMIARIVRGIPSRPTIAVDADGIGGGVVDRLVELEVDNVPLHGGHSPTDATEFGNARSEWYWALRRAFEAGEVDIDPQDEDLQAQLVAIKFKLDSRGRIWVETKAEMRKRKLPSPDRADTMAYAFVAGASVKPEQYADTWGLAAGQGGTKANPLKGGITGDLLDKGW